MALSPTSVKYKQEPSIVDNIEKLVDTQLEQRTFPTGEPVRITLRKGGAGITASILEEVQGRYLAAGWGCCFFEFDDVGDLFTVILQP